MSFSIPHSELFHERTAHREFDESVKSFHFSLDRSRIARLHGPVYFHRKFVHPRRILFYQASSHEYANGIPWVPHHVHHFIKHHRRETAEFPASHWLWASFVETFSYTRRQSFHLFNEFGYGVLFGCAFVTSSVTRANLLEDIFFSCLEGSDLRLDYISVKFQIRNAFG